MKTETELHGICLCKHPWHDKMIAVANYEERVQEIKRKPENQIPTRLRLSKPLTDAEIEALPASVRDTAWKAGEKAREAKEALDIEIRKHEKEMQKWHDKYCGCGEWDGKEIVFPAEQKED